jgi:hypothetical protein
MKIRTSIFAAAIIFATPQSYAFEPKQTVYLCSPNSDMACVLNEVFVWVSPEDALKAPKNNPSKYGFANPKKVACWVDARKKAKLIAIRGNVAEVDITISTCQGFVTVDYLNETRNGY